jgi:putative spermidine/putrescine transport system permease protein
MSSTDLGLTVEELARSARQTRRKKRLAMAFVTPLLIFILFSFIAPIGTMLYRSFYHPVVAELIPNTLAELKNWDGKTQPSKKTLTIFSIELSALAKVRKSGVLAEELNRAFPGLSSVVKSTARKVKRLKPEELEVSGAERLIKAHRKWGQMEVWHAMRKAGKVITDEYFLKALDLERTTSGAIQQRQSAKIYIDLYLKTFRIALLITLLCALLGYPLSYYLANASSKTANLLMVLVLLPFWTSLLVRTTAWIALLQTNGVINSVLTGIGITSEPLELLYTEFSTVIAMTHILLPFMILPLYSVMKSIDPSFMRAAQSMGAKSFAAFFRIYLPLTLPGISAGALLVFIISVGYYITPALVGGTDGQMISNIIAFHMQSSNNWELAAALGTLLLVLILSFYWLFDRLVGTSNIKLG